MFWGLLSWIGKIVGVVALIFTVASSLYYISEQLEEHTTVAKRYITRYIYFVLIFITLLWIGDGLPFWRVVWTLLTNLAYLRVMKSFPVVKFKSPEFTAALSGAVLTHFLWMWHFSDKSLPPYSIYERLPTYDGKTLPPFIQIASFFGLLIWAVPLFLCLSLSANDNVLPTSNESEKASKHRKGLAHDTIDRVLGWLDETLVAFGLKSGSKNENLLL